MPGLAGFCGEGAPIMAAKMVRSLRHRSNYAESCLIADRCCAISRMDYEWTNPDAYTFRDGDISVTVSGEVFNLHEVGGSADIRTNNPAVLIGRLVHRKDFPDHLAKLDGVFFATVVDLESERIMLVTDRYGLRHLYLTSGRGYVGFASEVKGLLGLSGKEDPVSKEGVRQFLQEGAFPNNGTWFENISMLPPASVTTIKIHEPEVLSQDTYWEPRSHHPDGTFEGDEEAACERLATLFRRAVERRLPEQEFIVPLSGGLDSRAILASIPEHRRFVAITFGQKYCADYPIAKRVSRLRGCEHTFWEITSTNWLDHRLAGVWWTDGQLNLIHLHALSFFDRGEQRPRSSITGYLGDGILGGFYLEDRQAKMWEKITGPGRRRVSEGLRCADVFLDYGTRCPFLDNDLVDFVLTLPPTWLENSRIYNKMLLREFPKYYRLIPWQKTGYPVSYPDWFVWNVVRARRHLRKITRPVFHEQIDRRRLANYPVWTREGIGRELFEKVLFSKSALYLEFVPRDRVQHVWEKHLNGRNEAITLARFVTIEIWLQQVFNHRFRPVHDRHDFGVSPKEVVAMLH